MPSAQTLQARRAAALRAVGASIDALAHAAPLTVSPHPLTILGLAVPANLRFGAPRIAALLRDPAGALASRGLSGTGGGAPLRRDEWDFGTARACMVELVRVFGAPAELDARCGIGGATALHLAVEERNVGAVEVLVGAGADVHAEDEERRTVVDVARGLKDGGDAEAVEIWTVLEREEMRIRQHRVDEGDVV